MHVYSGTARQVVDSVKDGWEAFVRGCVERFVENSGEAPGEAEIRSWRQSWPPLLHCLDRSPARDMHLFLEYGLPGCSRRVDALLLGEHATDSALHAVAVELKQWSSAEPHPLRAQLYVDRREVLHPSRQVGGYAHYLRHWFPEELGLRVDGLSFLHNASPSFVSFLRERVRGGPSAHYPILGPQDVSEELSPAELAERLRCHGLVPPSEDGLRRFVRARHRPSTTLLTQAATNIADNRDFHLVGQQDQARQAIVGAIGAARRGTPGHVVVVTGGPGTGKTAIAVRAFGDQCAEGGNPRLFSPSSTLTSQLSRALGDTGSGLISTMRSGLPGTLDERSVALIDEAHRLPTATRTPGSGLPALLTRLVDKVGVLVLFLDERQVVRPDEGTSLDELRRLSEAKGVPFSHIDLHTQFRCGGSLAYLRWVDALTSPAPAAPAWSGVGYDLALVDSPEDLGEWIDAHASRGETARIAAGFCWPWTSPARPPLKEEVVISWESGTESGTWSRPWNAAAKDQRAGEETPGRPYWGTDSGGHRQIGCIYTAQGIEYEYGGVIMGDDVTWEGGRWVGHPGRSHDMKLRHLPPDQYLRLALNVYRVLMTRGTKATRLYSVDPGTRAYLSSLVPAAQGPVVGEEPRVDLVPGNTH
ncbi:DNA/RNA helicase domain-containing protein [Streptomyces sp. NPDC007088]|uniref:DNA/RNA helicase domain-containing protein n=1 Tax=Streptomyces sp. NPDC007088 TaxID=3364773 RepID=UPI003698659F